MNIVLIAVTSISLSVLAQFFLKAGMSSAAVKSALSGPQGFHTVLVILLNPKVMIGFALYGIGAIVWLMVLSKWDVSKAYPLVGLGFAFSTAVGFLMGEQVSIMRLVGVVLISAGVFVVSRT